ncbi:MAG: ABC transporter permease [Deltaproteobacteria bacterium]|nr:ABC transporter permease [Deltaproteobacteria bacterium]
MGLPLSYAIRNVRARLGRTALTIGVIALAVIATSVFLALITSMKHTLVASGSPDNLIVLRKGSDSDGSSMLSLEAFQAIRFLDGVARLPDGTPLASPEMVLQPFARTRAGGRENVLVRGVEPVALAVHDEVRIAEGRMFRPSEGEIVVGRGVAGRYAGAEIGAQLFIGRRNWRVVGILESGGSSFESEIWGDARDLARDATRPFPYSGVRLKLAPGADRGALVERIESDPRYALQATPEVEYYTEQAKSAGTLYVLLVILAIPIGIAAGFGAANTMFAAVQSRTVEIGTLRALGFSRGTILRTFVVESFVLSLVGFGAGAVGTVLVAVVLRFVLGGIAFGAQTFTVNVVTLRVSASDLGVALLFASVIGLAGGLLPAWHAASLRPVEALRKA